MSFRPLDAWVDAGMSFVDTADVYSRWVSGLRLVALSIAMIDRVSTRAAE